MKNAARLTLALSLAAALLAVAPFAPAADPPKPVGTWDAVASTPNGDMPSVITIKKVEGALKAEIEIDGTSRTVTDEKLEGNVFRMKVQYEGGVYDVEAEDRRRHPRRHLAGRRVLRHAEGEAPAVARHMTLDVLRVNA